jgi:hypothetical protein
MSATERRKGAAGELEVIRALHRYGWGFAERTSNGRHQGLRGDVMYGPAGVHLEIKRQERLNVPAALDQATADAKGTDVPIVVHRPSRHEWMATLPLEELLPLLALREFG